MVLWVNFDIDFTEIYLFQILFTPTIFQKIPSISHSTSAFHPLAKSPKPKNGKDFGDTYHRSLCRKNNNQS